MSTAGGRRWGPIVTGVALALTFLVLLVLGTRLPEGGERASGPAPQAKTAPPSWMRPLRADEKPPQFVLFSFDGAGSHDHWQRVLPLAEQVNAQVTGFLSGIYLLPDSRSTEYTGPGHEPGVASINFGGPDTEVRTRIADLNAAIAAGHEIGTHYNGHFCAGNEPSEASWSTAQWRDELDQFFGILRDATGRGLRVAETAVRGGRTPCLEGDFAELAPAMADHEFTYDSSRTTEGVAWPTLVDEVWEFWVPIVRPPALGGKKVIMMDYNLWYAMNGAREEPSRDAEFTRVTLETYRAAFQAAYNTNRAPLTVGNHFNDWSGGAFTNATEQFMSEICVRAETVCTTYSQVIEWMSLQDPAVLEKFRAMPAAQIS